MSSEQMDNEGNESSSQPSPASQSSAPVQPQHDVLSEDFQVLLSEEV